MTQPRVASKLLLAWYDSAMRNLPWRSTRDPWAILVSEVMLQQTRVSVVIPYFERFMERFPSPAGLDSAAESELLALWSGLGYYSRARNLKRAASEIVARGGFPATYEEIRTLPGVGEYTAAAIASISFGLPHAVLDGNVLRVLSRFLAEKGDIRNAAVRLALKQHAQSLLDPRRPGDFNQALMELGATVCLPRNPQCLLCPWRDYCQARALAIQNELPVNRRKRDPLKLNVRLSVVEKGGALLLRQRGAVETRLAGFWELPQLADLPPSAAAELIGSFKHSITRHDYTVEVWRAARVKAPNGCRWLKLRDLSSIPLATMSRKALKLAGIL
jgi:A/G-specific adenine glycosylase